MYISYVFWSLLIDTLNAHRYREGDVKAGVKSSARLFSDQTLPVLLAFDHRFIALVCASGAVAGLDWAFRPGTAFVTLHLILQLRVLDIHDRERCGGLFNSNRGLGWLLLAAIVAGKLTR